MRVASPISRGREANAANLTAGRAAIFISPETLPVNLLAPLRATGN